MNVFYLNTHQYFMKQLALKSNCLLSKVFITNIHLTQSGISHHSLLTFLYYFPLFFSPIKPLLFIKKHLQPIYFHLYTLLKRCFIYPIPSFFITHEKEVSTYKNNLIEQKRKEQIPQDICSFQS